MCDGTRCIYCIVIISIAVILYCVYYILHVVLYIMFGLSGTLSLADGTFKSRSCQYDIMHSKSTCVFKRVFTDVYHLHSWGVL